VPVNRTPFYLLITNSYPFHDSTLLAVAFATYDHMLIVLVLMLGLHVRVCCGASRNWPVTKNKHARAYMYWRASEMIARVEKWSQIIPTFGLASDYFNFSFIIIFTLFALSYLFQIFKKMERRINYKILRSLRKTMLLKISMYFQKPIKIGLPEKMRIEKLEMQWT